MNDDTILVTQQDYQTQADILQVTLHSNRHALKSK